MAEPAGLLVEAPISQENLKTFLKSPLAGAPLAYYLCQLLHESPLDHDVFLFHYDEKEEKCFMAWMQNHFAKARLQEFSEILRILATLSSSPQKVQAAVLTTFPDVLWGYDFSMKNQSPAETMDVPKKVVESLSNRFWSFAAKETFPDIPKALKKKNYFFSTFKSYYKKYVKQVEEVEKPKRVAAATKAEPFLLFDSFHTYDGKVFDFDRYTKRVIEVPEADPLSLRLEAGVLADDFHVFHRRLAKGSPPKDIKKKGSTINNPDAIWEWYALPEVDGKSFCYVKEKWDTIFWKDKRAVYIEGGAKKVEGADPKSFEYLDFVYGGDQNQLFAFAAPLDVDVHHYHIDEYGFLVGQKNLYYMDKKLDLDAKTFKVLGHDRSFMRKFSLQDKNGKYEFDTRDKSLRKI